MHEMYIKIPYLYKCKRHNAIEVRYFPSDLPGRVRYGSRVTSKNTEMNMMLYLEGFAGVLKISLVLMVVFNAKWAGLPPISTHTSSITA